MNKDTLETYIKQGLSLNLISKKTGKSLTSIRYWTKKHNLQSIHKSFKENEGKRVEYGEYRYCPSCKTMCEIDDFYQRRGVKNSSTYCKKCTKIQTLNRMRKLKNKMVEYKGGECVRCGYSKYYGALEFHHIDPNEKDFTPSELKKYKFDEYVKKELDKCMLVCSNCHREIHHELNVESVD
jgi:5-methylcytosine-specific restriction endonuclease McrA